MSKSCMDFDDLVFSCFVLFVKLKSFQEPYETQEAIWCYSKATFRPEMWHASKNTLLPRSWTRVNVNLSPWLVNVEPGLTFNALLNGCEFWTYIRPRNGCRCSCSEAWEFWKPKPETRIYTDCRGQFECSSLSSANIWLLLFSVYHWAIRRTPLLWGAGGFHWLIGKNLPSIC